MRLKCLPDAALPHRPASLIISGGLGRISCAGLPRRAFRCLTFLLFPIFPSAFLAAFSGILLTSARNRNSSVIARLLGQIPLAESDRAIQRNLASRRVAMVTGAGLEALTGPPELLLELYFVFHVGFFPSRRRAADPAQHLQRDDQPRRGEADGGVPERRRPAGVRHQGALRRALLRPQVQQGVPPAGRLLRPLRVRPPGGAGVHGGLDQPDHQLQDR